MNVIYLHRHRPSFVSWMRSFHSFELSPDECPNQLWGFGSVAIGIRLASVEHRLLSSLGRLSLPKLDIRSQQLLTIDARKPKQNKNYQILAWIADDGKNWKLKVYLLRVVSIVFGFINDHTYNRRHQNAAHDRWADVSPSPLPIRTWPVASHLINVFSKPEISTTMKSISRCCCSSTNKEWHLLLVSININHSNHFHKSNHNKTNCASKRIKHL